MIDLGSGTPIVLVPGIQGRWEWMRPTVQALARRHRVLTFSLGDVDTFDDFLAVIDDVLDRAGESSAVMVGVSFGGLIALHYAARRPSRVRALVLVSTPAPRPRLDQSSTRYLRHPRLALPFFSLRGCARLLPEIMVARPSWPARLRLGAEYALRVVRAPISPTRMARHVNAWRAADLAPDCAQVGAPTLVITGEPGLDRVVPVPSTLEYLRLIDGARQASLPRTGHVGVITRPEEFANAIDRFLAESTVGPKVRHAS
jgi:pimeloyl-ACP methyl ester carboxylesterase